MRPFEITFVYNLLWFFFFLCFFLCVLLEHKIFILLFNTAIQQICYQAGFFSFPFFLSNGLLDKSKLHLQLSRCKTSKMRYRYLVFRFHSEGKGHCFTVHEHTWGFIYELLWAVNKNKKKRDTTCYEGCCFRWYVIKKKKGLPWLYWYLLTCVKIVPYVKKLNPNF